jgi:hypothetical protein
MKTYLLISLSAFAVAAPTSVPEATRDGTVFRLVALMSSPPGSTMTPILPVTVSGLAMWINGKPNLAEKEYNSKKK